MSLCAPFTISLIEIYFNIIFIMRAVTVNEIICPFFSFWIICLGFLQLSSSGYANARLPWCSALEILLEYCIENVTFGLLYAMFIFPARIFYMGVLGFATECPCGVRCRGLTICLLYVVPLYGNVFWNKSRFENLTLRVNNFFYFLLFPICLKTSKYDNTLFLPTYFHVSNCTLFST